MDIPLNRGLGNLVFFIPTPPLAVWIWASLLTPYLSSFISKRKDLEKIDHVKFNALDHWKIKWFPLALVVILLWGKVLNRYWKILKVIVTEFFFRCLLHLISISWAPATHQAFGGMQRKATPQPIRETFLRQPPSFFSVFCVRNSLSWKRLYAHLRAKEA